MHRLCSLLARVRINSQKCRSSQKSNTGTKHGASHVHTCMSLLVEFAGTRLLDLDNKLNGNKCFFLFCLKLKLWTAGRLNRSENLKPYDYQQVFCSCLSYLFGIVRTTLRFSTVFVFVFGIVRYCQKKQNFSFWPVRKLSYVYQFSTLYVSDSTDCIKTYKEIFPLLRVYHVSFVFKLFHKSNRPCWEESYRHLIVQPKHRWQKTKNCLSNYSEYEKGN